MRFLRCQTRVHVFITGWRVLGRYKYFSCACERGPSWGWLERRFLLPYFNTRPLAQLASANLFFLFHKVLHTLDISLPWLLSRVLFGNSHECSTLLLRVLFFPNVSIVFGGGSEVISNFSDSSCAIWIFCPVWYNQGSSLLYPGLWPSDLLSGSASVGSWLSLSFLWW